MAKVKGPLFSVTAWGTFGKIVVFQRRRGTATAYAKAEPKIPLTESQLAQRASVASAVSSWKALPGASKAWWTVRADNLSQALP